MFVPLAEKHKSLLEGAVPFKGGATFYIRSPAGEGAYRYDDLIFGFVLQRLASHSASYGSDCMANIPLEPGMGWLVPPGIDVNCNWNQNNDFVIVKLDRELLATVTETGVAPDLHVARQVYDPLLVQMALNIHELGGATDDSQNIYRDSMATAFAAHLVRQFSGHVKVATPVIDRRISRAVDFMEEHHAEHLMLETIAGVAAMSPFHFARSFKQAVGLPPHKYLASLRMEKAKRLLRDTSLPVPEVAFQVGYSNISHFIQGFRRHVGTTPGCYRQ
jgi:AraC family transcriptional regulator